MVTVMFSVSCTTYEIFASQIKRQSLILEMKVQIKKEKTEFMPFNRKCLNPLVIFFQNQSSLAIYTSFFKG